MPQPCSKQKPAAPAHDRLARILDGLEQHIEALRDEGVSRVPGSPASPAGPAAAAPAIPAAPGERATAEPAPDHAARDARLAEVARAAAVCTRCVLHADRRQAVPGQGILDPDILFIGEAPGEDEDRQGEAFVGRAGQMLTRLITRMGYRRDEVFIANIIKCRPPKNRKPEPAEMAACFPFLDAQIEALRPKIIVALGAVALAALVSPDARISRARGCWQAYKDIPLMPTYHPSYLLRNPSAMWDVWSDMCQVLQRLGRPIPPTPPRR